MCTLQNLSCRFDITCKITGRNRYIAFLKFKEGKKLKTITKTDSLNNLFNNKKHKAKKVERLFKTMDEELEFCNNDLESFRMRYNHFRPHSSLDNKVPADVYFDFHKLF